MAILFERIAKEKDLSRYKEYVKQLNDLLNVKARRLTEGASG